MHPEEHPALGEDLVEVVVVLKDSVAVDLEPGHGGAVGASQPKLEEVAFQLQDGQLSGIIQVQDKFVILRCEGRTERVVVDEADVRDELYRDIYEKKLRIAMSQKFEEINERARVDNYRAGTSHAPPAPRAGELGAVRQDPAVQPTAGVR